MGIEIERKFLVDIEKLPPLKKESFLKQGYIFGKDHTVVRIRIKDQQAFLAIKGKNIGASRMEFEYSIPLADAEQIITNLCNGVTIEKKRYIVNSKNHNWEIDFFHGENEGLVIAEIELNSENTKIEIPTWVTKEVTGEVKYYNSNLIKHPYSKWNSK